MKKKSLIKDTSREIQKSLGRFFSIMLIVALGVAFLAGIQVSAPMMRNTTDQYMDVFHMMDVRILSTLGIEAADLEAIKQLDLVESITGSHTIDTLATIEGTQKVIKVHSLQNLSLDDKEFINKPKIIEGRFPSAPNECLIDGTQLTRLPLKIGDTITLATGTDQNIEDLLENNEYTVVGIMNSPYYMHFERGSAEIGNGKVASFIYIPEDNFKSEIFTEAFVTLKGAADLDTYSEAYTALVDEFKAQVEPIMEERAEIRYEKFLEEGYKELEEGEAKLEEEKEKVTQQLVDAVLELEKAEEKIVEAEQALTTGEAEAKEGFKQGETAISAAEATLLQKQQEYEEAFKLFNSQKEAIETKLQQAEEELTKGKEQLQALKNTLQTIESQLLIAEEEEKESLLLQKETLEIQIANLSPILQVSEEAYNKGLIEYKASEQMLVTSKAMLDEGRAELSRQKTMLQTKKEETLKALESGRIQLEEAKIELSEGKKQYESGKIEAEEQIKRAKEELSEGKEALQSLKEPTVFLLGREANYGVANYKSAADTIDRIGEVFPIFFFIVAALVCLTTMTRMVDEGRTTIGTYKALGYSPFAIMSKYILYASAASLVGSILGILIGFKVFPNTIYSAYAMAFTAPPLESKFYLQEALSAILLMVGLTVFAAVFTTLKELKEQPSELMRPKAPAIGKRILLERIPWIWNKMNFFQKVVARNIFRYKKKFFMTTIGIAGCTALLVAGLGLKQSVISIVDRQYGEIFTYDLEVSVKEGYINELKNVAYVENALEVSRENMTAYSEANKNSISLLTIPDEVAVSDFIHLQNRQSKESLNLGIDGVVISEKLAKALEVKVGDTIQIENSDLERYEVTVAGITENYIGHYMYQSAGYAQKVKDTVPKVNQLLITLKDKSLEEQEVIAKELTGNKNIIAFGFTTQHADSFESMTASMDTVVIILIISAALLAFIVLYNLTTINISERYREIATIKVLGFDDFKVSQYIYRENIMLTLIGSLMGLILGKALFLFIIVTAEMEEMMFGRELHFSSHATAIILTFIFAMLVNIMMHFKLQKIEMVESLKSIE